MASGIQMHQTEMALGIPWTFFADCMLRKNVWSGQFNNVYCSTQLMRHRHAMFEQSIKGRWLHFTTKITISKISRGRLMHLYDGNNIVSTHFQLEDFPVLTQVDLIIIQAEFIPSHLNFTAKILWVILNHDYLFALAIHKVYRTMYLWQ